MERMLGRHSQVVVSLASVAALYALSAFLLYWLVQSAPRLEDNTQLEHIFPKTVEELKQLASVLLLYTQSYPTYVLILFVATYLFKQAFGIPGSVFLNLLGGALYGTWIAFPLCCVLTACGATLCYLISRRFGATVATTIMTTSERLAELKRKLDNVAEGQLTFLLISARMFPFTPNWFLNIVSPHLAIPLKHFFISMFIGLMPYNLICVQTGSTLSSIKSIEDMALVSRLLPLALTSLVAYSVQRWIARRYDTFATGGRTQ